MTPLTAHDAKTMTQNHTVYTTLETIFDDIRKAGHRGDSEISETLKMIGYGLTDDEVEQVVTYLRGMGYEVIGTPDNGVLRINISWAKIS